MTASKYVTIWCDSPSCGEFVETGVAEIKAGRAIARAEGWTVARGLDLCPAHRAPQCR